MIKKWVVKLSWWRGTLPKPRKNMVVKNRLLRARTIEELAKKVAKSRYRTFSLEKWGDQPTPAGYQEMLEARVKVLNEKKRSTA
jgi:hypothetical protein